MQTLVRLQRIRIAPRKMRMVVDLVRGKKVAVAKDVLRFSKNKGARILSKLMDSAVATARSLGQGDESNLMVLKIAVDEGPKLKRWRARAKGSAYPIQKKVSSITLVLDERGAQAGTVPVSTAKAGTVPATRDTESHKIEKQKFRPAQDEVKIPKVERGVQRFFRRKAIG